MKNRLIRVLATMVAVTTMASGPATAELRRGDRNGVVEQLQRLLYETGWLYEEPDGVFGKNTEQAVKDFEEWARLPVDGIADDVMIENLAAAHDAMLEESGYYESNAYDGYEPEGNGGGVELAEYCSQWVDENGAAHQELCEVHFSLNEETDILMQTGKNAAMEYVMDCWSNEVNALYDRWAEVASAEEQGSILTNKAIYDASIKALRDSENQTKVGIVENLRNQAIMLCSAIRAATGSGAVPVIAEVSQMQGPVRLNGSVIIDGNTIYYAGDIAGEGEGIYVLRKDGSGCRKIWEGNAHLAAVSNGALLVWYYDPVADENALSILGHDGSLVKLADEYQGDAIAADGRFYWGGCSVADDGSDLRMLFTDDPDYFKYFWPLEVNDGYLYFLDNYEYGDRTDFSTNFNMPYAASLCRIHLERDSIDYLSGPGVILLGIENGMAYYVKESFHCYDPNQDEYFEVQVDDGLYRMDLDTLEETRVFEFCGNDTAYDEYHLFSNGVFCGARTEYEAEENPYSIVRVTANGDWMTPISVPAEQYFEAFLVEDGLHYSGSLCYPNAAEGDFSIYYDRLIISNIHTGEVKVIDLPLDESMFHASGEPEIALLDGKIYYYISKGSNGAECLKCLDLNTGTVTVLTESRAYY